VVDVFAKDDGFGEGVGGLEKLGDLLGDQFGAFFEDQVAVEVFLVVDAVFDRCRACRSGLWGRQPCRSLSMSMRTTL
jgi:hypothetical protein